MSPHRKDPQLPRRSPLAALTTLAMLTGSFISPATAVQLSDGRTYFENPPRLEKASVSQNAAYASSIYSFILTVPEKAGEPLGSVTIKPEPSPDYPRFDLSDISVYEGTSRRRRPSQYAFQVIESEKEPRTITLQFDPPIPPGRTITIDIRAFYNPGSGGVYLYGVTAFPPGEKPYGQFLGFGRIHIYSVFDGSFFP